MIYESRPLLKVVSVFKYKTNLSKPRLRCHLAQICLSPKAKNPILDTGISVRPSSSVTLVVPPLDSKNGLDWRALVELCIPDIGKLRG